MNSIALPWARRCSVPPGIGSSAKSSPVASSAINAED